MKVSVNYRVYKDNEEATSWSQLKGYLAGFGTFIIIGLTYLLTKAPWLEVETSLLLSIGIWVGLIVLCTKQEKKAALRGAADQTGKRELTEEERKAVCLAILKEYSEKCRQV